MSDLVAALAEIRGASGPLVVVRNEVVAVACPIWEDGCLVAALGLYLPKFRFKGDHRKAVLGGLQRAAEDISGQVGSLVSAGEGR